MHKIKYIVLMLLFTTIFVFAERNPLLNMKMDKTNRGIIDIGVNNLKANELTTYLKELLSSPPSKRYTDQSILLQERNVTREDCIFDQFGIEGCTLATVNCINSPDKMDTKAINHYEKITGVTKIPQRVESDTPIADYLWDDILAKYPIYSVDNKLYTYKFFAAVSGTYTFRFKANGTGEIYVDGVKKGSVSDYKDTVSLDLELSGPKEHTISLKSEAPTGDIFHGLAATISYNNTQIWNTLEGQINGLTYTNPDTDSLSFNLSQYITFKSYSKWYNGKYYDYNYDIGFKKGWHTYNFYAKDNGNYNFMYSFISSWFNLSSWFNNANVIIRVDGTNRVASHVTSNKNTWQIGHPNPKPTFSLSLTKGFHKISFYNFYNKNWVKAGSTRLAAVIGVRIYNNSSKNEIWNTVYGQINEFPELIITQPNNYKLNNRKASIPIGYICPEGFIDTDNDKTKPGNTCEKSYIWRTYECPSELNENGMDWIGPVLNKGGDCEGAGVSDGGICPGQPEIVKDNCVRASYKCPTDINQKCIAMPDETNSDIISNGYEYSAGVSIRHYKKMRELMSCPESAMPKYFCPEGWDMTDNTRECIKPIDLNTQFVEETNPNNCSEGYYYESVLGGCLQIEELSKNVVIDEDNNAFYITNQTEGYDPELQICISNGDPICTTSGFIWNPSIGMCVKEKTCFGIMVNGECLEKPFSSCPSGTYYDQNTKKCQAKVKCPYEMEWNEITKQCEQESSFCPINTIFDSKINKCVGDISYTTQVCPVKHDGENSLDETLNICIERDVPLTEYETLEPGFNVCNDHYLSSFMVYDQVNKKIQVLYINAGPDKNIGKNCSYGYKTTSFNYDFNSINNNSTTWSYYTAGTGCTTNSFDKQISNGDIITVNGKQSLNNLISLALQKGYISISGNIMSSSSSGGYLFNIALCSEGGAQNPIVQIRKKNPYWTCPLGLERDPNNRNNCVAKPNCPEGYVRNDSYAVCYKANTNVPYEEIDFNFNNDKFYVLPICNNGASYNKETNKCEVAPLCPIGFLLNKDNNICEKDMVTSELNCVAPSYYDPNTKSCLTHTDPACPSGFLYNDKTDLCYPTTPSGIINRSSISNIGGPLKTNDVWNGLNSYQSLHNFTGCAGAGAENITIKYINDNNIQITYTLYSDYARTAARTKTVTKDTNFIDRWANGRDVGRIRIDFSTGIVYKPSCKSTEYWREYKRLEGFGGIQTECQAGEIADAGYCNTTSSPCSNGFLLNESMPICYKDEGPNVTYDFINFIVSTTPYCFNNNQYSETANSCSQISSIYCPNNSILSEDGSLCLSDSIWDCKDSSWTYQSSPSPFSDSVGSCKVPSECPGSSTEKTVDGTTYCANREITIKCEGDYSEGTINGREVCVAEPFCKPKWVEDTKEKGTCFMEYYWEEYTCPEGWEGPVEQAGGDCNGACEYNGCNCDSPLPPATNCRKATTKTQTGTKIEKRRPMERHNVTGETLDKPEFGTMRSQKCSENAEDCANYVDKITTNQNTICFEKTKSDKKECYEVENCSFQGKVIGVKQIGDTINIKAVDGSNFDYAYPNDPNNEYWNAYGFSISRHALLLSDGNWYIAENSLSPAGVGRGCGANMINGLGGYDGFKTIPNSNYTINTSVPGEKCLFSNKPSSLDCATDIDIKLPEGLTLVSISDLESVVSNVFMTDACNGDNKFDEHFVVNYYSEINRVGTGALAGTSFTNEGGSAILDEGYAHDVIHSLTLIDNHTIFAGYERPLGFRGKPSCGIYKYDPTTDTCITPVDYTKWVEFGDDSDWAEVIDAAGDKAMIQKINTAKPAFFVSPYEFDSYNMDGYVGVGIMDDCNDDDTIGLIFGFQDENNYYGVFWGGDITYNYMSSGEAAVCKPGGTYHNTVTANGSPYCKEINGKWTLVVGGTKYSGGMLPYEGTDNFPSYRNNGLTLLKVSKGVLYELGSLPNSDGWKCGIYAHFKVNADSDGIKVYKDGKLVFNAVGEIVPEGKAGYFGYSQANAYYKGFKVSKAPTCPLGTKLDQNIDLCREIECPTNLTLNKMTNMCQQVIKSTCRLNGNMGWKDRTGGVVSVGSSDEAKSYLYISVDDTDGKGLADFGDGTKWRGFNQATMALKLSDGYWYVSSYLKDTNGNDLSSQRKLPLKTRFLSPSNYLDLESFDVNGTKEPILCQFKGINLKQSICSRKLKIILPGFGLKVEEIADIESLYRIFDPEDNVGGEVANNNSFIDYNIVINNTISHNYSGTGQMTSIKLDKSETLIEEHNELQLNDRLRFWDSYEDGYIGFLEFMRNVKKEDQADGFLPEIPMPFDLNGAGFTCISTLDEKDGYLTNSNNSTFYIRPFSSNNECSDMAAKYNLTIHTGTFGNEEYDKIAKSLGAFNPGSCVLKNSGYNTPDSVDWAIKTEYSNGDFKFVCSPYKCQADHFCEMAVCPDGYEGGLYPKSYEKQYPDQDACELDACDTIEPYEPVCGKKNGCDLSNPRVIELEDGRCQEMYCPDGTGIFNSKTGLCETMKCPEGTHEIPSGDCIKD